MEPDVKIAPSILSADFCRLEQQVEAITEAGCDYIHVDVMDGRFVPNITIGQPVVSALRRITKLPLDVHLMIEEPERYVEDFAEAGADIITVHVEACRHLNRCVQLIRSLGKRAGVTLNPATPLETIEWVIDEVDLVLIMSVNPGFGGQSFIENSIERIQCVREMIQVKKLKVELEVDGGVNLNNIARVVQAGANVVVSGSGIFGSKDYAATIREMRARVAAN